MKKQYRMIRVEEGTAHLLKVMATLNGETIMAFVYRLTEEERTRRQLSLLEQLREALTTNHEES